MDEEILKQCKKITQELQKNKDSGITVLFNVYIEPFREPVPWKEWKLYDYPQIIKTPMDLSTVMKRLDGGMYHSPGEWVSDVKLIWTNCMIYNQESSEYYKCAKRMSSIFDQKIKKIPGLDDIKEASLEDKMAFSDMLYKLPGDKLGKVVTMLFEKSKDSVTRINQSEIDIHLDKIDNDSFRCIEAYVKSCIGGDNSNNSSNQSVNAIAVKRERSNDEQNEQNKKIKIEETNSN